MRNVSLRGCAAQTHHPVPKQHNADDDNDDGDLFLNLYYLFLSLPKQHNADDCDDNGDDGDNTDLETNVIIPTFLQNFSY